MELDLCQAEIETEHQMHQREEKALVIRCTRGRKMELDLCQAEIETELIVILCRSKKLLRS
jgi:hypothetical protein